MRDEGTVARVLSLEVSLAEIRYPVKKNVRLIWSLIEGGAGFPLFVGRNELLWSLIIRCISAVSVTGSSGLATSVTWMTSASMDFRAGMA